MDSRAPSLLNFSSPHLLIFSSPHLLGSLRKGPHRDNGALGTLIISCVEYPLGKDFTLNSRML
jgi:hypothetical protein